MSSLKFGTSGLRGLVSDLVGGPSFDYTAAFLRALASGSARGAPVLLGRDLRASSPEIAVAVAAAVRAAGLRPLDCGPVPTPALALEAMRRSWPAIMVTGSHIPDDRNGLKFYTARGEITKTDELAISAAVSTSGVPPEPGPVEAHPDALGRYRARSIAAFPHDALTGLRVGVYQQSSVARDLLVELVAALGGEPVAFGRASGFVPVDTEAHRPEDLAVLRQAAKDDRLDAIVTTDGDGDRPLVADAAGRVLPGDVVGVITARHLGIATVVVPVTAGSAVEASGGFARTLRTRVGSPFVIAGMQEAAEAGPEPVAGFEFERRLPAGFGPAGRRTHHCGAADARCGPADPRHAGGGPRRRPAARRGRGRARFQAHRQPQAAGRAAGQGRRVPLRARGCGDARGLRGAARPPRRGQRDRRDAHRARGRTRDPLPRLRERAGVALLCRGLRARRSRASRRLGARRRRGRHGPAALNARAAGEPCRRRSAHGARGVGRRSRSSISPSMTLRPMLQKSGSAASRPKGSSSLEWCSVPPADSSAR